MEFLLTMLGITTILMSKMAVGISCRDEGDRRARVTSNMEDYLETIYELSQETSSLEVRVTDISRRLKVTRPSVVGMIKHLAGHGFVMHSHYGKVRLTANGSEIAREMLHRHRVLRRFLEEVLGLDAEVAEIDACRMEHTLSPSTIDRFMAFEDYRESGERGAEESFRRFLRERKNNVGNTAAKSRP